jgi:putative copper export protein
LLEIGKHMMMQAPMTRGLPLVLDSALLRSFQAVTSTTASGVSSASLIVQAIFTWLALALTIFWAGGWIFEAWMLSPSDAAAESDLHALAEAAERRFQTMAPYALAGLLVADIGLAMAAGAVMNNGGWAGAVSPLLLGRILFGTRFGLAWWLRQIAILVALVITVAAARNRRAWVRTIPASPGFPASPRAASTTSEGNHNLPGVLQGANLLPRKLIDGVGRRSPSERLLVVLSVLLLLTFALSGQPTTDAVSSSAGSIYAAAGNLLYTFSLAIWLGGLFYVGLVLMPASADLRPQQRAAILARGLPRFSALAIICVFVVFLSSLLNMTILPITWTQFLTTTYGRTLAVMLEIFVILVGISVYHAYVLRPRLLLELTSRQPTLAPLADAGGTAGERSSWSRSQRQNLVGATPSPHQTWASGEPGYGLRNHYGGSPGSPAPGAESPVAGEREELAPRARDLEERLRDWLRREALLAGALLLLLTLLGVFGISLLPSLSVGSSSHAAGPYVETRTIESYRVTFEVSPDVFGNNTFTVTLKDATGNPVTGAGVMIQTNSLDMDMGTQSLQLKAVGDKSPGSYSGQSELTMAGHWQVTVDIRLPHNAVPLTTNFQFMAVY